MFKFLDSDYFPLGREAVIALPKKTNRGRWFPFIFLHAVCLGVFWVGWSWFAAVFALSLYLVRMFAITAFYHRYFSHRTFKTSRIAQCLFAVIGLTAVQRGPLWWAAHHRKHHRFADKEKDVHSPVADSFLWSHIGWITSDHNMPTDYAQVKDLARFPELVWLNRYDLTCKRTFCILFGAIGFAEAFIDRLWETDDLTAVVSWFIANLDQSTVFEGSKRKVPILDLLSIYNKIVHCLVPTVLPKVPPIFALTMI